MVHKIILSLSIILLIFLPNRIMADRIMPELEGVTRGLMQCNELIQYHEAGVGEAMVSQVSWIEGFLSGFNSVVASGNISDPFILPDRLRIIHELEQYCRKYPKKDTGDVLMEEIFPNLIKTRM